MNFPRYESYKDTGVEWLGEVPSHWKVDRVKRSIKSCHAGIWGDDPTGLDGDIICVRVADFDRTRLTVVLSEPTLRNVAEQDRVGRLLRRGDLLLEKSGGGEGQPVGAVVLFDEEYVALCSNFVARIELAEGMNPSYWRYLHSTAHAVRLTTRSINQTSGIQNLDQHRYFDERFVFPPPTEQTDIAAFLERETGKIDTLVAAQQQLIGNLQEKITAMVFAHLNSPDTQELRLAHAADLMTRPVIQNDYELYIPLGVYNRGRGLFHKEQRQREDMGYSDFFWVESGDLVISGQFAWEGSIALAGDAESKCVVSHRYYLLRGKPGVALTEYLFALLLTKHGDFLLNENSRGAAGRNRPLNINSLMKEKISVPAIHFQEDIAKAVHQKHQLLAESKKQIELLHECRSALISAAATGKIDVRGLIPVEARLA